MNSAAAYPSVWKYLKAALAGSIACAVPASFLPPFVLIFALAERGQAQPTHWAVALVAASTFMTMFLYMAFLVIGLPIFLAIRKTTWFRFPVFVIGFPVVLMGTGAIATLLAWAFRS